jgi:hypothetical protein
VQEFKASGNIYTHSAVWEKVRKRATKLAQWSQVKGLLAEDAFEQLGLRLSKQIGRASRYIKEIDAARQASFKGHGFDYQHSYVVAFNDEGEGELRVGWAMTGDEAVEASNILDKSIKADQHAKQLLDDERRRLPNWRGEVTWKEATHGAITREKEVRASA